MSSTVSVATDSGGSISITTTVSSNDYNPRVHFSDSVEGGSIDSGGGIDIDYQTSSFDYHGYHHDAHQLDNSIFQLSECEPGCSYEPQETVRYSPMYLCPQENFKLTRSSPTSPSGSNISIVGSLASPRKIASSGGGSSSSSWKLRTRYSKRRGQDRSTDRERQPSVCSDSETDSIGGAHVIEDLCLSTPTTKKWSLPLPIVTRSSESDSASSSWSARSADEATEDERSPVPSPSASTHSEDCCPIDNLVACHVSSSELSPKSLKAAELQTKKLAIKAKETEEFVYKSQELIDDSVKLAKASVVESTSFGSKDKLKGRNRKKKLSRAAESHRFQRMKTTNYGRCKICDAYVYFWGFECNQCELICHKKCLKKMAIMCPHAPLPPRSSILNLDIESLSAEEKVPLLVIKCTSEIERRSITRPGIYRMTGVASRVEKLLKSFESGPHLIDLSDVSANDLTSVLKVFLRKLKDPLVTNDVYKEFIDIGRVYRHDATLATDGVTTGGQSDLLKQLRTAVSKLTAHRWTTLRHMVAHLNRVASCQDQNSMTPAALGIIFAPTIFRPRDTINDLYTEVFEAAPQARVIELLIRFCDKIFDESDLEVSESVGLCKTGSNTSLTGATTLNPSPNLASSSITSPPMTPLSSPVPVSPPANISPTTVSTVAGRAHQCTLSSKGHPKHPSHQHVRRTSSTSSATALSATVPKNLCNMSQHHDHSHCLSSSASTFTFD